MTTFPLESAYRAERAALVTTLEGLDAEDFDRGDTLCEGWAPRDVLAHLLGIDALRPQHYLRGLSAGNARTVAHYQDLDRVALLETGRRWAEAPATHARALGCFLLGDVAIHHQDVLRPRGLAYDAPRATARAIYREGGLVLSGTRLLTHKLIPTDGLARPVGVGRRHVHGRAIALGLWSAGRRGLDDEVAVAPAG